MAAEHVEHAVLVGGEAVLGAECTASAEDVVAAYAVAAVASVVGNEPHGWLAVGVVAWVSLESWEAVQRDHCS